MLKHGLFIHKIIQLPSKYFKLVLLIVAHWAPFFLFWSFIYPLLAYTPTKSETYLWFTLPPFVFLIFYTGIPFLAFFISAASPLAIFLFLPVCVTCFTAFSRMACPFLSCSSAGIQKGPESNLDICVSYPQCSV